MIGIVKILDKLSSDRGLWKKWRIDPFELCQTPNNLFMRFPFQGFQHMQDFREFFISLSNNDDVEKLLKWCRIEHGWSSTHHNRTFLPVLSSQGDSCKVEHVENIGDIEFVGKGKTNHVHGRKWCSGFESCKGAAILPQVSIHITPRRKATLTPDTLYAVCDAIE